MQPVTIARLQIHFCVILWGFTAILGKLISLSALPLVWWRMFLVALLLFMLPKVWKEISKMPLKMIGIYAVIGAFVGLHWLTFYASIKLSNASIAATCMAFAPAFISLIEPIIAKRMFSIPELLLSIFMLPGIILVVGGVDVEMQSGIWMGALSALLVAIFSSLNKLWVTKADALTVTGIEMFSGTLLLTLMLPLVMLFDDQVINEFTQFPSNSDFMYLLILAIFCTLLPFALSLIALRKLSAYSVQLIINLEPVYTIIIAIPILGEQRDLSLGFYLGVSIIITAVMVHPYLQRLFSKRGDVSYE